MTTPDVREKLIKRLDKLTDEQVAELLRYVEVMQSLTLPEDYDPDHDPAIGFFSGPPALGMRTKEILRAEFGLRKPASNSGTE